MAKLTFKDAEVARDAIMASQKKEIEALYKQWADEIGKRAEYYAHKTTASSVVSEAQMRELKKMLEASSAHVSQEIQGIITDNIYTVADSVVQCNTAWMAQFGFSAQGLNAAFNHVPDQVVKRLVTGQIYEGGWNLSKRIWSDNQETMRDAYRIVAKGMAENKPIYDIAKELQQYVTPGAAKPWNPVLAMKNTQTGKIEYKRIYKGQVDYNAQRLARTLVQHSYQQSFIATTGKNPFVLKYIWHSNGSRPCQLCQDRDGQEFAKGDLPMDHPNGQCTMEPVIADDMIDQLADWFNDPDGTYPDIDEFAKNFGYIPNQQQPTVQDKWLQAAGYAGGQLPKNFTEFAHKLSFDQQSELLKAAGGDWNVAHPFQMMEKYYNENIMPANVTSKTVVADPVKTLGTSTGKKFNYWYTKLDDSQKALAKSLKDQSGLTWQQWYEKNIYSGKAAQPVVPPVQSAGAVTPKTSPLKAAFDKDAWMARIRGQSESYMLASEATSFSKMTSAQVNGIKRYTGSSYTEMNGYLRNLAAGMSHDDAVSASGISDSQITAMNNAIAGLSKASLDTNLVLRRGTDLGDLAGFMPGDFWTNRQTLSNMTVDELNARFAGTVGTYAGFTSTSSLYDRGFSGNVEIIFNAPVGTTASSVMSVSQYGTVEGETLLNAGTKVFIEKIEASDGHKGSDIRVFMNIIP